MNVKKKEWTYYCNACGEIWDSTEDYEVCKKCGSASIVRVVIE